MRAKTRKRVHAAAVQQLVRCTLNILRITGPSETPLWGGPACANRSKGIGILTGGLLHVSGTQRELLVQHNDIESPHSPYGAWEPAIVLYQHMYGRSAHASGPSSFPTLLLSPCSPCLLLLSIQLLLHHISPSGSIVWVLRSFQTWRPWCGAHCCCGHGSHGCGS